MSSMADLAGLHERMSRMWISRREVLQSAGAVVCVGGSAPLLSGCTGLTRIDVQQEDVAVTGLKRDELRILELASLAPSGHNTQPWGIRLVDPYTWIITSDEQRWLPAVDPDQRETLLSIGAFIENLVVAAGCYGYEIDLKLLAKTSKDTDIVEVTLNKINSHSADNGLAERITRRRVVRKGYLAREIGEGDLRHIINDDSACFHYFPPHSRQGRSLSEGTIEANRQQAYRNEAQEELAEWIRWSDGEAKRFRDGLTPAGMEIAGLAGWYVRHFYRRKNVLSKAFRDATVKSVMELVGRHGGWLVITSEESSVASLLKTGRRFQRMFLRSRDKMIAIHPMTQMLEETQLKHEVVNDLGLTVPVQFILRVGYLEAYPDPVTLRRPVSWFVRS